MEVKDRIGGVATPSISLLLYSHTMLSFTQVHKDARRLMGWRWWWRQMQSFIGSRGVVRPKGDNLKQGEPVWAKGRPQPH